jgi:three-Cys-motif partner protein
MDKNLNDQTNNPFLECQEDGEYIKNVPGNWGMKKLHYLNRYFTITTVSMSEKPWRQMNYIDLFAGCGKNRVSRTKKIFLGSPVLALKLQKPFTKYYFVDNDETNLVALRARGNSSNLKSRIKYFLGDGNEKAKEIVKEIAVVDKPYIEGVWNSFNVAFLDPFSFELQWDTISQLASIKFMDLIIYYPQNALERAMPKLYHNKKPSVIDIFFGTDNWRRIYESYKSGKIQNLHRELLDFYWSRLSSFGYLENNGTEPLITNTKNAPLYRLILASKDKKGIQFWNEAIKRDEKGQLTLC